eukprot:TRINITY_DN7893_c0_g1_i1.p1 TRINITY_DN7893_c0_g1~~TRINITY_DN7893_c0_g1_i1.p1  ORF type:complete len:268 (-),score=40.97 TRINITY_DN7893_c0_g1_i1:56-859(-)
MKRQRDAEEQENNKNAKKPKLNVLSLSNRLRSIVSFVQPNSRVADVACHHAHVAVHLVLHKIASQVIGTELTEGSWQVACDTVTKYQVQHCVDIRLGDGLMPLAVNEVDTIIIAGVGTSLAVQMLKQRPQVVAQAKQLILQPQFECEEMRRYLHSIDFKITEEKMIAEHNQFYTIISAEPGTESYDSEEDYKHGRLLLLRSDPVMVQWWENKLTKLLKNITSIENNLSGDKSDNASIKLAELQAEVNVYRVMIQKHTTNTTNKTDKR